MLGLLTGFLLDQDDDDDNDESDNENSTDTGSYDYSLSVCRWGGHFRGRPSSSL